MPIFKNSAKQIYESIKALNNTNHFSTLDNNNY